MSLRRRLSGSDQLENDWRRMTLPAAGSSIIVRVVGGLSLRSKDRERGRSEAPRSNNLWRLRMSGRFFGAVALVCASFALGGAAIGGVPEELGSRPRPS